MSGDTLARLTAALAGRFQIERELDGGGMSRVFLAVETALGRNVVLKVLPAELAAVISVERFRREILLLARLQHAHIVPVLSAGDADGLLYFSMPYVEGESLRVRLARQGELPLTDAIRMLREIASALSYAHAQGVVHRDIKPANVLLSGDAAMVTDFGVAKALRVSTDVVDEQTTSGGVAMGTAAYMAPEQASADPALDHRADLYAFGVLAYELLTGQPPFVGRTPQALLSAHVAEAPEPVTRRRPALPPAIAELVMRCLEKRPADRPQSATDIIRVLDELSPSGRSAPAAAAAHADPDSGTRRVRLPAVRGARITGVLLVVGAVISVAWWGLSRESTVAGGMWRGSGAAADATTIAVLPFKSAYAGDEYLADGLTDELPSALKKIPGLRVMGGRSVYAFKSKPASVAQIGRALKVGALLEGTVRRSGSRLKITTQLTKVSDGLLIWSESYESDAQDVFRVQSEIASAIAGALQLALAPDSARHVVAAKAPDPRAHDLYLQGRFSLYKFTKDGVQQAPAVAALG